MKKRTSRCSALYSAVAALAVAAFLLPVTMAAAPLARALKKTAKIFRFSILRVLYYNIAITGNVPADLLWPAGSSFAVMPESLMHLSLIYTRAILAFILASACAVPVFAAGKGPAVAASTVTAVVEMQNRVKDSDPEIRAKAAAELGSTKEGRGETLKAMMKDGDPRVRAIAAKGMAKAGDPSAYQVLAEALAGEDLNARLHAIEGLGELKDNRSGKLLMAMLGSSDLDTRWKAVQALGNFSGGSVADALLAKAADETEDNNIRRSALEALVKIGDKGAVAGLRAINSAKAPEITKLAGRAAAIIEAKK